MKSNSRLLVYVHIPKTGGTSFTHIINQNCPKCFNFNETPNSPVFPGILKDANAFCGHYPFGIHNRIARPCNYITMLRDPVEQVISWFYFKYKDPDNPAYDKDMSLSDYIDDDRFDMEYVNNQTRYVSGDPGSVHPNIFLAKENIIHHFSLVGISEMYAESQFLLMRDMGWKLSPPLKLNVNLNRPLKEQIHGKLINKIKEKNEIDIELYRFATMLLNNRLATLSPAEKEQLAFYKK